jgi:hypothetical protein
MFSAVFWSVPRAIRQSAVNPLMRGLMVFRGRGSALQATVAKPERERNGRDESGFTRFELAFVLGALAGLGLVIIPALADANLRSSRVICANNLRQISIAFQRWAHDHEDQLVFEVPVDAGGTRQHALASNVWLHFSWVSNELSSPQWLVCPNDDGRPARDFGGSPEGGYLHPDFANRATSYFLSHAFTPMPAAIIAGDRNVLADGPVGCSRFLSASRALVRASSSPRWTNGLHETSGNLLRADGAVEQFSSRGFSRAVFDAHADNGNLHFITPR